MLKRLFDVVVSIAALVLLSPVLLVLAIWVKWDSKGPVLYQQTRVGRLGRDFRILKFRSMKTDQAAGGLQITVGDDPRITRSGKWIRRYKLDELPQLWNVVRGDMSLVGPRPEVPRYVALYTEEQREQVLSVRPGITDQASILFRHESELLATAKDPEETYKKEILPCKLQMNLDYVKSRSFCQDLKILGQTFWVIFR